MTNANAELSSVPLKSGEWVSLGAIEITSIPHGSILDPTVGPSLELLQRCRAEFTSVLNEVYQVYKSSNYRLDLSAELLWRAVPVKNQSFLAELRIFLLLRSIASSKQTAEEQTARLLSTFYASLSLLKYELSSVPVDQHKTIMAGIDDSGIRAIVKEENAENLQNLLLPYCYSFGRFPITDSDFSRIINVLVNSPGAALSFQLIPTHFSPDEASELDRTTQALETLRRGVMDQGIGQISYSLAEPHADTYRYYSDHKNSALYLYNILIYGSLGQADSISSRVYGELASGEETARLKIIPLRKDTVQHTGNFYPLPWAVSDQLLRIDRNTKLWHSQVISPFLQRFPYIITSEEAATFFRLPIGSDQVSAGLNVNQADKGAKTFAANLVNAGDITAGRLKSASGEATIGFGLKDLAKHMLIVGTPGSGKTTFSVSLLDRLWKQHSIPFLVIEPAKNEYRALIQSIPDLQVFTPGKNFISPFVFNPFVPPKNVRLETYKSTLKTAFSAGVSMTTPLDKIFEETINNCYSDFRWLDSYTSDNKGRVFNISDFINCFQKTFDAIGYSGDAKNIGRAGVVRLKSLVNLFDNYYSIPVEDMLKKPTVIELAAIENTEEKALIIALILLSVLAYVNANYTGEGGLRNVILLEEAHVLLSPGSTPGQGDADPSMVAQNLVKRMLAEIRSYGVGIVIADQSPRKVTTDVVALTDMKVVFRLVENDDKQIIGNSTGMTETQIKRLAKLKPGEAFFFFNKLEEPEEIVTPDYRLENNISISLSDESIASLGTYWKERRQLLRPYPQCEYCPDCSGGCEYERRLLAREIARRLFNRYLKPGLKEFSKAEIVFKNISKLTQMELNDEPFSIELVRCVKVHLWRKIIYETQLHITDALISNTVRR